MMLLMAAAASTSTPTDPRPVVDDPVVMAMRPAARPLATFTIGAGGDFATFGEAIAAGLAVQDAALTAAGLTRAKVTPNFRIDYLVSPGAYNDPIEDALPPWSAFYATDTTRGNTIVNSGMSAGPLYWEGIDVTNVDVGTFDPKYPFHLNVGNTTIITRCTLSNPSMTAGGRPTSVGTDGYEGGTVVVHDATFLLGGTNQHDVPTLVYSQVISPVAAVGGGPALSSRQSEVWVVGGSVAGVTVGGTGVLHLDPSTVLTGPVSNAGGTSDSLTDWPVPAGGLSVSDRAYYGM